MTPSRAAPLDDAAGSSTSRFDCQMPSASSYQFCCMHHHINSAACIIISSLLHLVMMVLGPRCGRVSTPFWEGVVCLAPARISFSTAASLRSCLAGLALEEGILGMLACARLDLSLGVCLFPGYYPRVLYTASTYLTYGLLVTRSPGSLICEHARRPEGLTIVGHCHATPLQRR